MNRRGLITGLSAVVACGVIACGEDEVNTQAAAPRKPKPPPELTQEEPVPAAIAVEYHYDPTGKADPFRSFVRIETDAADALATPLERFDLTQLEVTAIIWGADRPRALIRTPAGKGHIVSEGTPIGKNQGRIVSIQDNVVLVKETYVDFRERQTTKEVEMRLYDRQGG